MMQAIPDGVIIFDPRWRVAEINQAIRMLLGWSDTIVGQPIAQALQQSTAMLSYDIMELTDPISELERRAQNGLIDEFKMIGADGRAYTIRCTYTPIRDDLGDTFAFVVIFHDVTEQTAVRERIEAEVIERTKELAQRNEELKILEHAREDFFTTVAHELKTPLANIRAHLNALLTHDVQWSLEEQHASLLIADEQAERLVNMVNHILDASRVEAGALQLNLEAVLLPELFEDLEERLKALIISSKRHLHITYPDTLPAVCADYERIMSVLTNLLSNAFRYAPEGDTVVLKAEPIFAKHDGYHTYPLSVRLYVNDTGPGITQEQQKVLFTRFSTFAAMNTQENNGMELLDREQRHVSSRWSSATGLGLYISRGIVEAHESKLVVRSEPGQGASFSFTLPAYEAAKQALRKNTV
jgi:PAS domain S-box-containing protein